MTKQERKAARKAFMDALIRHDESTRLDDLEARVLELEQWPDAFAKALRDRLLGAKGT